MGAPGRATAGPRAPSPRRPHARRRTLLPELGRHLLRRGGERAPEAGRRGGAPSSSRSSAAGSRASRSTRPTARPRAPSGTGRAAEPPAALPGASAVRGPAAPSGRSGGAVREVRRRRPKVPGRRAPPARGGARRGRGARARRPPPPPAARPPRRRPRLPRAPPGAAGAGEGHLPLPGSRRDRDVAVQGEHAGGAPGPGQEGRPARTARALVRPVRDRRGRAQERPLPAVDVQGVPVQHRGRARHGGGAADRRCTAARPRTRRPCRSRRGDQARGRARPAPRRGAPR